MHISEGVLSAPVLIGGAALAVAGTAIGLKKIDYDRIMTVAILSAAFFVASLVHVPIGPGSAHLLLNGLLGLMLGWAAFPSILVALLLQAVLFQFGGLTVLGLNTFNMAAPAVFCFYVFRPLLEKGNAVRFGGRLCLRILRHAAQRHAHGGAPWPFRARRSSPRPECCSSPICRSWWWRA